MGKRAQRRQRRNAHQRRMLRLVRSLSYSAERERWEAERTEFFEGLRFGRVRTSPISGSDGG